MSYLGPLHNLLNSIPNVATSIRNINERIDNLENTSFAYVPTEEIERKLEDMDARLLELENRMEEHNKVYAAIDVDHSSFDNVHTRRQAANAVEMTSFTSNYSSRSIGSAQSMTSSALIVAAMDRREIEGIKERLDDLEAIFPTAADPWQIEVVLLPWGRELKGIWFTPDELMHGMSKATTQDSEEWTQARSLRSASRSSLPLPEAGSGWSSQAIHAWTDTTDEWLSPKACGTNNLVYKRLQSRGFIRKVTIKSSNARDIQAAIVNAFGDLLEHLENTGDNNNSHHSDAGDQAMDCFHGLRASFIPLRKVHKSSKLLFLTPDEMISAAHWTAHFLNSGVLMRAAGGQRRLFVTQREAYLQQSSHDDNAWTWQRMRELPRVHLSPDLQKEGNTDANTLHVAEADAKEACWSYYPACDPPASTTSSFSSSHSGQLSLRPAESYHWPAEATLSTRPKPKQPISPLSEFPQKRPSRRGNRTVSVPLTDDDAFATAPSQFPQGSSKRRIGASFDAATCAPHPRTHHAAANLALALAAVPQASNPKRRRLTHSHSPPATDTLPDPVATAVPLPSGWAHTPRRSKEPPSPFFSENRTGNGGGRAQGGGGTPFAYATPHSGTVAGAGFTGGGGEGDTEVESGSWHGVGGDEDSEGELSKAAARGGEGEGGSEDVDVGIGAEEWEEEDSGFGDEDEYEDEDEEDEDE